MVERKKASYIVEELDKFKMFTGRLLLNFEYRDRARRIRLENHIKNITVNKIFEFKYTGETFKGYDNINHNFLTLEHLFRIGKSDWKVALENVKGVYLLTDIKTGKKYVGSAYSDGGIWKRWYEYLISLHGWNEQLIDLVEKKGEDYIKNNFNFTILETYGLHISNDLVIARENYWKDKLMTRLHGYNSN